MRIENEEINQEIISVWKKHEGKKGTERWPLLFPNIKQNKILFIGINPGFDKKFLGEGCEKKYLFSNNLNKEEEIEREKKAKEELEYRGYFRGFEEIKKECKIDWEHVDLFFYRNTSQKELIKIIEYKEKIMNEFGEDQLKISLELIKMADPKIIVVSNAMASHILKKWLKIDSSDFEKNGFDFAIINNKRVPIFFSGMLTEQRALDKGSFRRLKWHIRKALGWCESA